MKNNSNKYSLIISILSPLAYGLILFIWAKIAGVDSIDNIKSGPIREFGSGVFVIVIYGLSLIGSLLFVLSSKSNKILLFFLGLLLVIYNTVGLGFANEFGIGNDGYFLLGTIALTIPACIIYTALYFIIIIAKYIRNKDNNKNKV